MPSLLILAALAVTEHQVLVRAGRGATVTCVAQDAGGAVLPQRLAALGPGRWRWEARGEETLTCSSPGFEPISWRAGPPALPRILERRLWPARNVTLRVRGPAIDAVIEWRRLARDGTALLARQRKRIADGVGLPVAPVDRVIRLHAEGLSPVSLFVPEGAADLTLPVPAPRAGGALLGTLPAHAFPPLAVELAGPGPKQAIAVERGHVFHASGLSPGPYLLAPRYRGGLRGPAFPVVVRAGETTERVPLALPEPGAVSLALPAAACAGAPRRLVVRRVGPGDAREQAVWAGACGGELEGLEPGLYEAIVEGSTGAARFEVRAGAMAEARLATAEVRVAGRVTVGADRPAPGLTLVFESAGRSWTARTDDQGAYGASLGPPGDYRVAVRSARDRLPASFRRAFQEGEQAEDFALAPAGIRIRARREDGGPLDEEIHLAVTSRAGERISAPWRASEGAERHLAGLDLGEYWITARSSSGLVSRDGVRVELTADEPEAEAELVLGRHEGVLEVTDERGFALPDAQVEGREAMLAPVRPGAFALRGVPVGEWLAIRSAGFLPACRVLEARDLPAMRVALARSTETLTLLLEEPPAWEKATLQLDGSRCPIALGEIERESVQEGTSTTVRLRLPRGRYRLDLGGAVAAVDVPGRDLHPSDFTPPP